MYDWKGKIPREKGFLWGRDIQKMGFKEVLGYTLNVKFDEKCRSDANNEDDFLHR
jgi:hypothetical protein